MRTCMITSTRNGSIVKVSFLHRSLFVVSRHVGRHYAAPSRLIVYHLLTSGLAFPEGAWLMHPILIFVGKVIIDTIPGMRQEISWTLVNLIYLAVSEFSTVQAVQRY